MFEQGETQVYEEPVGNHKKRKGFVDIVMEEEENDKNRSCDGNIGKDFTGS
jgi:hypothetical protein